METEKSGEIKHGETKAWLGAKASSFLNSYEKNLPKLLFIPIFIFLLGLIFLGIKYSTGDIVKRDIGLSGGVSATVYTDIAVDIEELENFLQGKLQADVTVRKLTDPTTGVAAGINVESQLPMEKIGYLKAALREKLVFGDKDITTEEVSPILGASFFKEMVYSLIFVEIFIAIVVAIIFRKLVPSAAVVFSGIFDMVMSLTMVSLFGIKLSTAGIAAFLMILGYAIDTDVLLVTKMLKRRESPLIERITDSAKTGLTMTFTTIGALIVGIILTNSVIIWEIFIIVLFGLLFDLVSTWLMTAGILSWYVKKMGLG